MHNKASDASFQPEAKSKIFKLSTAASQTLEPEDGVHESVIKALLVE